MFYSIDNAMEAVIHHSSMAGELLSREIIVKNLRPEVLARIMFCRKRLHKIFLNEAVEVWAWNTLSDFWIIHPIWSYFSDQVVWIDVVCEHFLWLPRLPQTNLKFFFRKKNDKSKLFLLLKLFLLIQANRNLWEALSFYTWRLGRNLDVCYWNYQRILEMGSS